MPQKLCEFISIR